MRKSKPNIGRLAMFFVLHQFANTTHNNELITSFLNQHQSEVLITQVVHTVGDDILIIANISTRRSHSLPRNITDPRRYMSKMLL